MFSCIFIVVLALSLSLPLSLFPAGLPLWKKTGGPSGGLGYDVRIHPKDKKIMFVTDNPSGVNKSYDGGQNWKALLDGLTTRAVSAMALSGDGKFLYAATKGEGVFRINLSSKAPVQLSAGRGSVLKHQ